MDVQPTSAVQEGQHAGPSMKTLTENALEANKAHQHALARYTERLISELQEIDKLMSAVSTDDGEDEPTAEIQIPGAKKAMGLCPPSEFLNPQSPFFEDASRRTNYINQTTSHPMKSKELEALAEAVRGENQRLQALESQKSSQGLSSIVIDLDNNTDGIDWTKVAEKVSTSSNIKRTADQCRIKWIGDRHPRLNHGAWDAEELDNLSELVRAQVEQNDGKVDWVFVASELGTNRTPVDCMRRGFPRQRHTWNHISDQKLLDAVKLYGTDNWGYVARVVSEDATSAQCQGRYYRALDPSLKRGPWSEAEFARLKIAAEAHGNNWTEVASCIPGRTNEQCRERWTEHLNMFTGKEAWTEEEDEALINAVKTLGNQWKAISIKLSKERTSAQCRLRYEKLKKLKGLHMQVAVDSSGPSTAQPDETRTNAPLKGRQRAKEAAANPIPEGTGSESPSAPTPKPRPKPRPIGKKGKEKAADPATPSEPASETTRTPSPTRGKRSATQDLAGVPPKKRKTTKSSLNTDVNPQVTSSVSTAPKKPRNSTRARRARTLSVPQSETAPLEAEEPTEREVERSGSEDRHKNTSKLDSQQSSENPQSPTAALGEAPPPVKRPRGRPRKITATKNPTHQPPERAEEKEINPSIPHVEVETPSAPALDSNPSPKHPSRAKVAPSSATSNPENTPQVTTPRRQSARVAARRNN